MNLEEIATLVSLGNLLSYSIVDASVISLRFREPQADSSEIKFSSKEKYPWLYLICAFLCAFSIGNSWNYAF
jgi:amino acid transporter